MRHTHEHRHEGRHERDGKTATEQVVDEFEEAETDPDPEGGRRTERRNGEAGDAITPSPQAQEQADGE
jgi:hypothetical protein